MKDWALMKAWFFENGPAITILLGGSIAAAGALWAEFREHSGIIGKKFVVPALLIFFGSLLAGGGAYWDSIERSKSQEALIRKTDELSDGNKKLASKSDEIASLNRTLAAKSDEIARLNQQIAASVTGGNEFCYLVPQIDNVNNRLFVIVKHYGKYPIYDVGFRVLDFSKGGTKPYDEDVLTNTNQVGNMAPHQIRFLEYWQLPNRPFQAYNVFFTARNNSGFVIQSLRYAKVDGVWKAATKVQPLQGTKIFFQSIDAGFPLGTDGKVNWNDPVYGP